MQSKEAPRRRHSEELKAQVVAACAQPGALVAAIAQAHGLSANLVHKWRRGPARAAQRTEVAVQSTSAGDPGAGVFVPLQLPSQPAALPRADIHIELRRGATSVTVTWPTEAAGECANWMREVLR